MNVEFVSKREAEDIAYMTVMLVYNGWRQEFVGGGWIHPEGKKLIKESTIYHSCGCCSKISTHEHDTYSLEEACEEIGLY